MLGVEGRQRAIGGLTTTHDRMPRILVIGAGGLGGYLGGRLIQMGLPVTFLVRPERAKTLSAHGLVLRSVHGDYRAQHVDVLTAGGEAHSEFDVALISVKAYDLPNALDLARPFTSRTVFIPLLNGGEHLSFLTGAVGPQRVAASVIYIECALRGNEVHQTSGFQRLIVHGAFRQGPVGPLLAALSAAGLDAAFTDDIGREVLHKWMFISAFAAMTSLVRGDMAAAWADPFISAIGPHLVEEVARMGVAQGTGIGTRDQEEQITRLRALGKGSTTSMARDLEGQRPLELDAIHRAVVRTSAAHGVAAPAHAEVVDRLAPFEFPKPAPAPGGTNGV